MRTGLGFSPQKPSQQYNSNEKLFLGLQNLETTAIATLQTQVLPVARQLVKAYNLHSVGAEDILNKSTAIFLEKIADGTYLFQGHAPSTYLIEVIKRVALRATQSREKFKEPLDKHHHIQDESWEEEQAHQEAAELAQRLLSQLGDPCQTVVRLHHIDGYSDEEVIQRKLTPYSTVDSLKMKRSDCMKKLLQLGQKWKTSINI